VNRAITLAAPMAVPDTRRPVRRRRCTWGGTLRDGDRRSSAMRMIFDSATGEVLSIRISGNVGDERHASEHTYLRAEQTGSIPRGVSPAG